jgi:hypothetical protein
MKWRKLHGAQTASRSLDKRKNNCNYALLLEEKSSQLIIEFGGAFRGFHLARPLFHFNLTVRADVG